MLSRALHSSKEAIGDYNLRDDDGDGIFHFETDTTVNTIDFDKPITVQGVSIDTSGISEDLTELQTQVNTNTSNISTNTTSISTLDTNKLEAGDDITFTGNIDFNNNIDLLNAGVVFKSATGAATWTTISSNATRLLVDNDLESSGTISDSLGNLRTAIQSNTTNINSNDTDITNLQTQQSTNTSNISTNTSNISTNTSNISTNTSNISTNTSNISTNTSNISTNTSNIASNDTDITNLQNQQSTNTSNISTNTSNISTNTSNISTNTSNISTNTSNIASNDTDITNLQNQQTTNTSNISTNTSNITALQAADTSILGLIASNDTDISNLQTQQTTNTSNIATNTSNIASNDTDIANLQSSLSGKVNKSGDTMTGDLNIDTKLRIGNTISSLFGNLYIQNTTNSNLIPSNPTEMSSTNSANLVLDYGSASTRYGMVFGTLSSSGQSYIQCMRTYASSSSNYNLLLNPNGGNVGIGITTGISHKLHIKGSYGINVEDSGTSDNCAYNYFGVEFNRLSNYLRPATDNDKILYVGYNSKNWSREYHYLGETGIFKLRFDIDNPVANDYLDCFECDEDHTNIRNDLRVGTTSAENISLETRAIGYVSSKITHKMEYGMNSNQLSYFGSSSNAYYRGCGIMMGYYCVAQQTAFDGDMAQRSGIGFYFDDGFTTNDTLDNTNVKIVMTNKGYMNIQAGFTNDYPLQVGATETKNLTVHYWNSTTAANNSNEIQSTTADWDISIFGAGYIGAGDGFLTVSDIRIKKDFEELNDNESLDIIRKLWVGKYKYIDEVRKGKGIQIGFKAQDVMEHLPEAITITKNILPNVYDVKPFTQEYIEDIEIVKEAHTVIEKNEEGEDVEVKKEAEIIDKSYWKTTIYNIENIDENIGDRIILYDEDKMDCNILEVINNNTESSIICRCDKQITGRDGKVYVYGYQVKDFHTVSKEKVFAVGISAIQELDKKQKLQEERITALEIKHSGDDGVINTNDDLLSVVNNLREQIKVLQTRINYLELNI